MKEKNKINNKEIPLLKLEENEEYKKYNLLLDKTRKLFSETFSGNITKKNTNEKYEKMIIEDPYIRTFSIDNYKRKKQYLIYESLIYSYPIDMLYEKLESNNIAFDNKIDFTTLENGQIGIKIHAFGDKINEIEYFCKYYGYFISQKDNISKYEGVHNLYYILILPNFDQEIIINENLYHITKLINWERIKKNGLTPKSGCKIDNHPERIYFTNNVETFMELIQDPRFIQNNRYFGILEYKPHNINKYRFFVDPKCKNTVYTLETIHPMYINLVEIYDKQLNDYIGLENLDNIINNIKRMYISNESKLNKKIKITPNQLNILKENTQWLIDDMKEIKLPIHIIKGIKQDKTSLGNHPAFPPDDESKFVYKLLSDRYSDVINKLHHALPDFNFDDSKTKLSKLLKECYKIEKPLKSQLEMLVMNIIKKIFQIDGNDIDMTIELVDVIPDSELGIPLRPESVDDVEFDGIEELENVNECIYKRRMVNCLMQGISNRIIHLNELYAKDIILMNDNLFPLYKKIIALNEYNLFNENPNILNENEVMNGSTSQVIVKTYDKSVITVKGINFLSLLYESIRAVLDLISFNGLPEDKKQAMYVIKKSDFRLAGKWDELFGIPLWFKIENKLQDNMNITTIPYLFYEIVINENFNNLLMNVFAGTKQGTTQLTSLYDNIQYNIEKELFDMELEEKRKSISNDDNKYFNIDDL